MEIKEGSSIVSATEPSNETYWFLAWKCSATFFPASSQNFSDALSSKILQTCSIRIFGSISGSSALLPPLWKSPLFLFFSGKLGFIYPEASRLSDILPSQPSPTAGCRFPSRTLNSNMALQEIAQLPRLRVPRCVMRIPIITRCYAAHATPSLNCPVTNAKQDRGGPRGCSELCGGNLKKAAASSLLCYWGAASFITQAYFQFCLLTPRIRRRVLGEGKSNYDILYNWTLDSKLGFMHELTFPALLIFTSRSSHSHPAPANQQYTDDLTQPLIMQLEV